jgi:hypothetical protein
MLAGEGVSGRMAKIRGIHEDAQFRAGAELNDDTLIAYLETTDAQFRSIAYEGASMSRGLLDISHGGSLHSWLAYMQRTQAHSVQVYIGLGWALSQRQVPLASFFQSIAPIMHARVLDGYGYYEGMFRNRTTIRDKSLPGDITGNSLRAYDQGVGRSLWYFAKGSTVQLERLINGFSDERKLDLWRGVGIAAAYVGGDDNIFASIYDLAASYQTQLATGAMFLAHSRMKANTLNEETELACRTWCDMGAREAIAILEKTEPIEPANADAYIDWVKQIEEALISVR